MSEFHWYVSSVAEWRTGVDLRKLLNAMDRKHDIAIWRVPGPDTATYEINWYAPHVQGVVFVGYADASKMKPDHFIDITVDK